MAPETRSCPKCGGGVAYPTFADENGTNYRCFECSHGFTQPASDDKFEGSTSIPEAIATERTGGDPAVGSVLPSGESLERAFPSRHADAGPGLEPEQPAPAAEPEPPAEPPAGPPPAEPEWVS